MEIEKSIDREITDEHVETILADLCNASTEIKNVTLCSRQPTRKQWREIQTEIEVLLVKVKEKLLV